MLIANDFKGRLVASKGSGRSNPFVIKKFPEKLEYKKTIRVVKLPSKDCWCSFTRKMQISNPNSLQK